MSGMSSRGMIVEYKVFENSTFEGEAKHKTMESFHMGHRYLSQAKLKKKELLLL